MEKKVGDPEYKSMLCYELVDWVSDDALQVVLNLSPLFGLGSKDLHTPYKRDRIRHGHACSILFYLLSQIPQSDFQEALEANQWKILDNNNLYNILNESIEHTGAKLANDLLLSSLILLVHTETSMYAQVRKIYIFAILTVINHQNEYLRELVETVQQDLGLHLNEKEEWYIEQILRNLGQKH